MHCLLSQVAISKTDKMRLVIISTSAFVGANDCTKLKKHSVCMCVCVCVV